jgi:hypothetical protein
MKLGVSNLEHSKSVIPRGVRVARLEAGYPRAIEELVASYFVGPRLFFNKTLFLAIESTGESRAKKIGNPMKGCP